MAKVRKQTYTLQMYLQKVRDKDIRDDQDVQRMSGAWNNSMSSELIVSVLNSLWMSIFVRYMEKAKREIQYITDTQRRHMEIERR